MPDDAPRSDAPAPEPTAGDAPAPKPTAPAKPAPPPPPELSERGRAIAAAIRQAGILPGDPVADHNGSPMYSVESGALVETALRFRDQLGYRYLSCLTALEWPDAWETVYHLYDFDHKGALALKARIPKDQDTFLSVTPVWP
ncbi:MAG: NADH-quinone oxidoreductase subunit C, partial [Cyanobacteria bacterium REEB65]|nr:NADH-quinone oxidoreductase subunit C [Cyanobacteria bacterium REEB65]